MDLPGLRSLDLHATQVTDRGLRDFVADMPRLQALSLAYLPITDVGLASLDAVTWLESMNLKSTSVSNDGIVRFVDERAHCLKRLNLAKTVLNDDGLAKFPDGSLLDKLSLRDTAVGDAGLQQFPKPAFLRELILRLTDVTDDGVRSLEDCGRLACLDLSHTKVTDTSLVWLSDLLIEDLELQGTAISDAGMPALTDFAQLRRLDLEYSKISNRGLRFLSECESLSQLFLMGTRISAGGLAPLSQLPLTALTVSGSFGDHDLQVISQLGELQHLAMLGSRVSSWSALAELPDLRVLFIDDTNKALDGLGSLQSLKHLILWGDAFSPERVSQIRLALRGCRVHALDRKKNARRLFRSLVPR